MLFSFTPNVSWVMISLAGLYLGMTVPVVNEISMLKDGSGFKSEVLTAYYLPAEFQANPPQSHDPDITIVHRDSVRVITR